MCLDDQWSNWSLLPTIGSNVSSTPMQCWLNVITTLKWGIAWPHTYEIKTNLSNRSSRFLPVNTHALCVLVCVSVYGWMSMWVSMWSCVCMCMYVYTCVCACVSVLRSVSDIRRTIQICRGTLMRGSFLAALQHHKWSSTPRVWPTRAKQHLTTAFSSPLASERNHIVSNVTQCKQRSEMWPGDCE